jgi:hypothetical protein
VAASASNAKGKSTPAAASDAKGKSTSLTSVVADAKGKSSFSSAAASDVKGKSTSAAAVAPKKQSKGGAAPKKAKGDQPQSSSTPRATQWHCVICSFTNAAMRSTCTRCSVAKPSDDGRANMAFTVTFSSLASLTSNLRLAAGAQMHHSRCSPLPSNPDAPTALPSESLAVNDAAASPPQASDGGYSSDEAAVSSRPSSSVRGRGHGVRTKLRHSAGSAAMSTAVFARAEAASHAAALNLPPIDSSAAAVASLLASRNVPPPTRLATCAYLSASLVAAAGSGVGDAARVARARGVAAALERSLHRVAVEKLLERAHAKVAAAAASSDAAAAVTSLQSTGVRATRDYELWAHRLGELLRARETSELATAVVAGRTDATTFMRVLFARAVRAAGSVSSLEVEARARAARLASLRIALLKQQQGAGSRGVIDRAAAISQRSGLPSAKAGKAKKAASKVLSRTKWKVDFSALLPLDAVGVSGIVDPNEANFDEEAYEAGRTALRIEEERLGGGGMLAAIGDSSESEDGGGEGHDELESALDAVMKPDGTIDEDAAVGLAQGLGAAGFDLSAALRSIEVEGDVDEGGLSYDLLAADLGFM